MGKQSAWDYTFDPTLTAAFAVRPATYLRSKKPCGLPTLYKHTLLRTPHDIRRLDLSRKGICRHQRSSLARCGRVSPLSAACRYGTVYVFFVNTALCETSLYELVALRYHGAKARRVPNCRAERPVLCLAGRMCDGCCTGPPRPVLVHLIPP